MSRRAPAAASLLGLLVLAAAGCGGSGNGASAVYTAKATAPCLAKKGFHGVTQNPDAVGLIAAAATNGGLRATGADGNVLTIAFSAGGSDVDATKKAFTRFAPPKLRPHIGDIMETQGNAVLVWTVTPPQQELQTALGCLSS